MNQEEFTQLTAEQRRAYACTLEAKGVLIFVNEGWHDIQRTLSVTFPNSYWGNRHMTVMPWPTSSHGDIVTHDGIAYEVIENITTSYGPKSQYTRQWAIFAMRTIPANQA